MSSGPSSVFSSLVRLRQFGQNRRTVELCGFCAAELPQNHEHLLEIASRKMECVCKGCAILFTNQGQKYQRIPYKWSKAAETVGFRGELSQDFSALAAGQGTPASGGVIFTWLPGWWKVTWRGDTFFYFFERNGQVKWTPFPPVSTTHSIATPRDTGTYTCAAGNAVTIQWGATGSVEAFHRVLVTIEDEMRGTWNGREPLSAEKL